MRTLLTFIITTFILATCGSDIAAAKTLLINKDRVIDISGPIESTTMKVPAAQLTKYMKTSGPIYIIIDSGGGEVLTGVQFITLMHRAQARGRRIVCVVNNFAMSMAFGILTQCDRRYAFGSSFLLWHKVRQMAMMMVITRHKGRVWEHQIGILDDYLDHLIFNTVKVPKKYFDFASNNNIVHTGQHIKKISPKFMILIDDFKVIKRSK